MTDTKLLGVKLQYLGSAIYTATIPEDVALVPENPLELEKCLKLGDCSAAATALYVVAKSIEGKWRWLRMMNIFDNSIEVSVPQEKEEKFKDLVQKGALESSVMHDFENIETNLEGILEENQFEKYGENVLELIREFRICSIKEPTSTNDPAGSVVTGIMVHGNRDVKEFGNDTFVLDSGTSNKAGTVAAEYIAAGGRVSGEKHGGSCLVAKGYRGGEAAALAKAVKDDVIRVKIVGDQLKNTFEREFKPRTTIYEVRRALQRQEQISGKIVIKRRREFLPDELTLAQAEADGSTVNWRAEILE